VGTSLLQSKRSLQGGARLSLAEISLGPSKPALVLQKTEWHPWCRSERAR